MAKYLDDDLEWADELEAALILDAGSPGDILRICKGKVVPERLRPKVWLTCLSPEGSKSSHVVLSEIFDLPEQTVLRGDCQQFVANLGNDDEDKLSVISDLETILTTYRKNSGLSYERNNGWLEIMLPLLSLKRQQAETYNLFSAIREKYVPQGCSHKSGDAFHLFRLLLLYHEPELCSFLDTKRITPDLYCTSWTLFSASCNLKVILSMWDLYFQQADPYFLFFLALVMVVNAKDQILEMEKQSKEDVIEMLTTMPSALEVDDVPDFCSLAQYYALKTPSSFRAELQDALFGIRDKQNSVAVRPVNSPTGNREIESPRISQALCLPVSAQELVDNVSATATSLGLSPDSGEGKTLEVVRFFLVDCRPVEQYNAGHLPTAFHLDCNLMLQEPAAFTTAVQGLLSAQRQALAARSAAGGEHLCFLGSGRNEEDQYTHMVVASFLQKHTHYVSMLSGGYQAIHQYLADNLSGNLEHHNPQSCLVCIENTPVSTPTMPNSLKSYPSTVDIFSKFSAAVSKIKAAEVKGKLLDYIVNPTSSGNSRTSAQADRHVSANDKLGRRYRNVSPVFSIDDEQEFDTNPSSTERKEDNNQREIVSVSKWSAERHVVASFCCHEIKVNRTQYDSLLILTDTHLYILRIVPGAKDSARVVAKRALESIVKITSRKKQPEIVTFKYGYQQDDEVTVADMDRLYIPDGKEATYAVVNQVNMLMEKSQGKAEQTKEEASVENSVHESAPAGDVPMP